MKDVLSAITTYREERGWTEYQLAERSGLPQSTISSWYRKNMIPTIPSLEKICAAFGITLSQLFAEGDTPVSLTNSQQKLLERWSRLREDQQAALFALIDTMKPSRQSRSTGGLLFVPGWVPLHIPGISRKNGILFIGDVLYYSGIPPREPACDHEPDGQIRF